MKIRICAQFRDFKRNDTEPKEKGEGGETKRISGRISASFFSNGDTVHGSFLSKLQPLADLSPHLSVTFVCGYAIKMSLGACTCNTTGHLEANAYPVQSRTPKPKSTEEHPYGHLEKRDYI